MISVRDPKLPIFREDSRDRTEKISVKVGFDFLDDLSVDARICEFDPLDRELPLNFEIIHCRCR